MKAVLILALWMIFFIIVIFGGIALFNAWIIHWFHNQSRCQTVECDSLYDEPWLSKLED